MRDSRGKTGFRDPAGSETTEEALEFVRRKASVFPRPPIPHYSKQNVILYRFSTYFSHVQ
ncbi:hypothetical protein GCM10011389_19390 [Pontibacillus salipaludis]|uniref:Uncharacterized protein n=1 Tax=Pontibacillus salipaludis TaxID=1697394 RepID=A0ABQ1Q3Z5_9BACI|nr:hypothetical protein GCM10011389_19390 [Pontibacillus salipaludis]